MEYRLTKDINIKHLLNLYNDANWKAYTQEPSKLKQAVKDSLFVISVWDNNTLLGLCRVVGDGQTIIYIQDILVLQSYKRKGIGTILIQKVLEKYKNVRQKVLLTEESEETRGFYESLGFQSCDDGKLVAFIQS